MSKVEKCLYPTPEQSFDSLKSFLSDIRKQKEEVECTWDDEEYFLWMQNLWFGAGRDVISYIDKKGLKNKLFAWGIGKYWDAKGNCAMAVICRK